MGAYVLRRLGYGVGVALGVLFLLFVLFFTVTAPDDIARKALGEKAPQVAVVQLLDGGHVVHRDAPRPVLESSQGFPSGDRVEPRSKPAGFSQLMQLLHCSDKGVLRGISGIGITAELGMTKGVNRVGVSVVQLGDRGTIAGADAVDEDRIRCPVIGHSHISQVSS